MRASAKSIRSSSTATQGQTNGDHLRRAIVWVVSDGILDQVKLHGNVKWTALALVRLAIFWVWSDQSSLVTAANDAVAQVARVFGGVAVKSYQALTGALKTYTGQLLPLLWERLHQRMQEADPASWRVGRWLALAVDGSRVGAPRTAKNEQAFCKPPKKRGTKRTKRKRHAQPGSKPTHRKSHYAPQPVGPQVWLTLIWHIGQQLPWCWKIGPSYASERTHVQELLGERPFPENTLICGDAGFVGYNFWRDIADRDQHFLVRVGGNVRLLKNLGHVRHREGLVFCWPDAAMKKKQPPLVLRLMQFHGPRGDVYLVTNVLDKKELSDAQASEIYRRRWGIEIHFRALKQTFGRTKLRSRTPQCAEVELHWSLIGLWMLRLLALKEQTAIGEPPERTSVAAVLRIIRSMMHTAAQAPLPGATLGEQLANAVTDTYHRRSKKKSRNYPRRKEEPSAGKPQINPATTRHLEKLSELKALENAA